MNIFDLQATITLNSSGFEAGIQNAQSAMRGFSSGIGAGAVAVGNIVADMATTAASGLMDFGKDSINTGMNFDAAMSNVQAVSGATAEEFDALRASAMDMGATTKFTATQAAEAFSYMGMAGWDASQMLSGISGIMNLAAASGEDLATTSDIVTDALTAFGLNAEDAGHFADILAAASAAANTNVGLMGATFKYVAPLAGTLGYSIEDMATAIGAMANSGIKGGQAGTALRQAIFRLVNPTEDVTEALSDLGLDGGVITDADGNTRSFADTIAILRDAFSDLTEEEQTEIAAKLFAQEAMSGMLAIINTSAADYNALADTIAHASDAMDGQGAAAEMAGIQLDNLKGDITILNSALDGFKTAVYDKIKEPLRDAAQGAADALSRMTEGFRADGIRGAVAALGDFIKEKLRGVWDNLKLPPAVEKIADTLKGVFDKVKNVVSGWNISEAFSGMIEKIKTYFEKVKSDIQGLMNSIFANSTFQKVIEKIKLVGEAVVFAVKESFGEDQSSEIASGIGTFFDNLWGFIKENALPPDVYDAVVNFELNIKDIFGRIKTTIDNLDLGDKFSVIAEKVRSAFDTVKSTVSGIDFAAVFGGIADKVGSAFNGVKSAIGGIDFAAVFSGIAEKVKGAFDTVKSTVSGIDFAGIFGAIREKIAGAIDAIKPAIEQKIDSFKEIFANIQNIASGIGDAFKGFDTSVFSSIAEGVKKAVDAFARFGAVKMDAIVEAVKGFASAFDNVNIGESIAKVAENVLGLVNAFAGASADLISGVASAVSEFIDAVLASDAADSIANIAKNVTEFLASFIGASGDMISSIASGVREFLEAFPSDELGGIIGNVARSVSDLLGAYKGVLSSEISGIAAAVKTFFAGFDNTAVASVIADVAGVLGNFFGHFTGTIAGIISSIGEAFSGFGEKIATVWNTAGPNLQKFADAVHAWAENTKQYFDDFYAAVQPVLEWLTTVLSYAIQGVIENIVRLFGDLWNTISDFVAMIYEGFNGIVSLLHGDVTGAIEHIKTGFEKLGDFFKDLGQTLITPFQSLASMLGTVAEQGVDALKRPFEGVIGWFTEIGTRIVEGIKSGISGAWGSLTSFISDACNNLVDGVFRVFKINSPSKVFAEIGSGLVEGMQKGWADRFDMLERQVMRDSNRITDTVRTKFEESAIGRSSTAGINTYLASANNQARGGTQTVNVVLDSDVIASAIYDPLQRENTRRGGTALADFRRDFVNA